MTIIAIHNLDAADRHWEAVVRNWLEPARAKSIAEYSRDGEDAFWEAVFSEWEEIAAQEEDHLDPSPRKAADLAVRMVREWMAEDMRSRYESAHPRIWKARRGLRRMAASIVGCSCAFDIFGGVDAT